jgi:glycosyltransferase involved in cell wall biosynthesis
MISVMIITLNEEKQIARCIQSVAFASEIIVVDSGSIDNTVAIAKSLGAKVFVTDWPGYGAQKQRALDLCSEEWVLSLDADEFLETGASDIILQQIRTTSMDAFKLPIRMVFHKQTMRFANSDNKHIRLFKKSSAHFSPDKVHEKVLLKSPGLCGLIPATILHESYEDWHDALYKMNLYSSLSANKSRKNAKKYLSKAIAASLWLFLRNYLFKLWFLDGQAGFLLAIYQAQGSWYRYIKQMYPNAVN